MTVYGEVSQPLLDLLKTHAVGFKWFSFLTAGIRAGGQGHNSCAFPPQPSRRPARHRHALADRSALRLGHDDACSRGAEAVVGTRHAAWVSHLHVRLARGGGGAT